MDFENCYADRLAQAIEKKESRLVVGIDPRLDRLPEELTGLEPEDALLRLGSGVIEAIAEDAAAVKPQIAFFERWGWRGWRALEGVCQKAVCRSQCRSEQAVREFPFGKARVCCRAETCGLSRRPQERHRSPRLALVLKLRNRIALKRQRGCCRLHVSSLRQT